ncbi:hypothetical protein G9H62_05920 [Aquirufa ecclesiirivi]|uniref:hypothetical protein n=1 Tax=Aquirufa ecclesiirivi TaxID=2715124 RepID=UPI0022A88832|nr:hypothetical protein [Aquirufa ecclesiirivi]MCZ2472366.1 hypothetical protein [Aquirufa ecclesiirivi]
MPVRHKFYQTNFGNGYATHNAILYSTKYKPEVMILGTFNPDTPNANFADFFYGRNFLWTALKNLIIYQGLVLQNRRMPQNGNPRAVLNPTLLEIFEICFRLKLTFSDLVLEVLHADNPNYQLLQNDNIIYNQQVFNLIQDGQKKEVGGLQQLNALNQVNWNTQNIIKYLCDNPQIKSVYFTRRPTGIWADHWNQIVNHECMAERLLTNIFTPSGQGRPVFYSMARLLNHWLHNDNHNFGKLDNNWLTRHGVNINDF